MWPDDFPCLSNPVVIECLELSNFIKTKLGRFFDTLKHRSESVDDFCNGSFGMHDAYPYDDGCAEAERQKVLHWIATGDDSEISLELILSELVYRDIDVEGSIFVLYEW